MKSIFYTLIALCPFVVIAQSWQATNLTNFNAFTVTGLEYHNNQLYSVYFNSIEGVISKLNTDEQSWSVVTQTGITGIPKYIRSAGNEIYLTTSSLGYSMVYRSDDDLATFVVDTIGLPKVSNGVATPVGLDIIDGNIVANLGSAGYWIKENTQSSWRHIETSTLLNGGVDPITYSNDTIFAYDNSGTSILYVSGDNGMNFSVRNTNLPANFEGNVFTSNPINGRLYLAGGVTNNGVTYTEYGIYYSDNNGFSWTMADLSNFIATDVNGGQQEVKAIFSNGTAIYVALENDTLKTGPDVLSSSSGITNLDYDTLGLLVDPAGSVHGLSFLEYKNKIALQLNVRDVYLSGISSPTTDLKERNISLNGKVIAYPNPFNDRLEIRNRWKEQIHIKILDVKGRNILERSTNESSLILSTSGLPKGIYFLQITTPTQGGVIQKLIHL